MSNFHIDEYLNNLLNNSIAVILLIVIVLDCLLGSLRAIKEKKFNSTVGIDGVIRKVAMIFCMMVLGVADTILSFNLIGFIPSEVAKAFGNPHVGIGEFFSIMFILYECVSVLKNMALCGLPISKKLTEKLKKFLNLMTDELHNKDTDKKE